MSALTVYAAPPTKINAPQVITVSGSYILANDITASASAAGNRDGIDIRADDVTLNLDGHTINISQGNNGTGITIDSSDNARVSNGTIIVNGGGGAVKISSSYCLVNKLNITVAAGTTAIELDRPGNYNRVLNCMVSGPTGQSNTAAFFLFLTSHNTIQNNTLAGTGSDTIIEQDQAGALTVAGDNTFIGNKFANPTQ